MNMEQQNQALTPSVDEPWGGTLRFSGHWILANVCLTQTDILASASSTPARAEASIKAEHSPIDVFLHPTASAYPLAPCIFSTRALEKGKLMQEVGNQMMAKAKDTVQSAMESMHIRSAKRTII
nr:signal anchor, putative [Ipomoea batatas]